MSSALLNHLDAFALSIPPVAYRIFWYYGPDKKQITILTLTPHP